ncbi:MAG: hypothetical protein LBL83_06190 [Clostridiales bacterium]|nr:hypothetical protein [Clostridiales bacterium]
MSMGELEYRPEFAGAGFSERTGGDGAQGAAQGGGDAPAGGAGGARPGPGAAQDAGFADKRTRVRVHIGSSASTFVVNVTGASGADMSGSITHLYSRSEYGFRTLFEFVATLQGIADTYDYPQKGYRLRTWDAEAGNPAAAGALAAGAGGGPPARGGAFAGAGIAPSGNLALGAGSARGTGEPRGASAGRAMPQGGAGAAGGAVAGERQADARHAAGERERKHGAGSPGGGEALRLSFVIRLQYRQNASWQGEVQWTDCKSGSATVQFRSLLELLALMWEARALAQES